MRFPVLLAAMLLATLLAGCHDVPEEEDDPPPAPGGPTMTLADLQSCWRNYPGTEEPVRCENEATRVEATAGAPTGELPCVDSKREGGRGARLLFNATSDMHLLNYWAPRMGPEVSGIIAVAADGDTRYYNWDHAAHNATVALPALPADAIVHLLVFTNYHQTPTPALAEGHIRVDWSFHAGRPYPVRVLETSDNEYYFPPATPVAGESPFPYLWEFVMELPGKDFHIYIYHDQVVAARLDVRPPDDGSC
jgi:hypothetical protein